ncbi:MAG: hypothetical protein CEE43_13195 [Promethearchaeota archaeon Loki_b32]|nr:MAG: hypothetical protein CEE43_13195 [Candidatus Lokiarchaeota archaeon Loki_b32]
MQKIVGFQQILSKNILRKVRIMGNKISIILLDDLKEEIDKLKEIYKEEQSSYIRKLLWKSVAQEKLDYALNQFIDDKTSLGKSAEIAGISIWEMLDELHKRNITLKYKISEAELEIEKILKKYKKIE